MTMLKTEAAIVKKLLKLELEAMLERSDIAKAVVTVTTDGLMLEKVERKSYPLKRVATMGSSLMSLGDTITAELNMGSCRNLISENKHGILAFMHINKKIVLVTLTEDTGALGMFATTFRNKEETSNGWTKRCSQLNQQRRRWRRGLCRG